MSFSRGASRPRVGVVSRASLSPETAENVVMQISGVIKFGAPMYNKGDARGCARLYRQTALSIARDASAAARRAPPSRPQCDRMRPMRRQTLRRSPERRR